MSFKAALLSGGKGGGGSFKTAPDNLRSTDTFELLVGLGSGRIHLAPGGLKNLFIDDVPVEDGQGKSSFTSFAASMFDGDPTTLQPIKLNLGGSSGLNSIGLTLSNTYTSAPGDWKNGAVTQPGVDYIDLRFIVQQLYAQTKNGVSSATATIEVELRPSGAANWTNPLVSNSAPQYSPDGTISGVLRILIPALFWDATGTQWSSRTGGTSGFIAITGKTTSPYIKELRIAVPNTGAYANKTWEVRCRLREQDSVTSGSDGENQTKRSIIWDSVSGVSSAPIGGDENWRGISYLQMFGKATDQIAGIPEITGVYDLDLYPVPPTSVWDPTTRVYTGAAWDGATTQLAWTQCPAWQIKKLIEDDLSGVSALAPGSTLNKWDTLEASKWFSQQVPDGKGGTQPRYSANWYVESPMQVEELVNYLAGAVGSFAWDEGDGKWRLKVEKPETPQVTFTKENIIGEFIYQHTDIDTRYNDITVVYRDRDNRYTENRVRVFNQPNIDATGRRATTLALVGCDNRQEALRRGYIRLLTGLNETRMVSFKTNRIAGVLEPFSVVTIADGDLNSDTALRSTGRIVDSNTDMTRITLRDTLRLELGVAYTISLTIPNPDYNPATTSQPTSDDWRKPTITITRNVVNTADQRGDVRDIYLDSGLPSSTPEFAAVALSAPGLPALPKQYRILGIQPDPTGETADISAIEIYTSKWVESDAVTEDAVNSQISNKTVNPPVLPSAGMFRIDGYLSSTSNRRVLVVNWDRPAGSYIDGYKVNYRYNGGQWTTLADSTPDLFHELPDPPPGTHEFEVVTRDRRGLLSLPLSGSTTLDDISNTVPIGLLTNETHTVATASDGTGFTLTDAGGQFVIYAATGQVDPAEIVFSVDSHSGATATIDATGVYTITGLSADAGTITFKAVWSGYAGEIKKVYSISKSKAGTNGTGTSAKLIRISTDRQLITYDGTGAPSPTTQTITFSASEQNSTATVNWTLTDLNGVARTPATYLSATSGNTVTMTEAQFATARNGTPGVIVKATIVDGVTLSDQVSVVRVSNGAAGTPAISGSQVFLYKRSATVPTLPTTTSTYTFATGILTGQNNGWTQAVPAADGNPLYVTAATAVASTSTDTIAASEWAAPVVMTQDGLNTATVMLYQRSLVAPSAPTGSCTYTFATGVLTGQGTGWSQTIPPANGYALYAISATALGTTATDTIATGEWSTPAVIGIDTSDDTMSAAEKQNSVVKFAADLDARYNDLISRATTLGLSTTALATARSNWLNLLGSYSPAWNETTKDTVIYSHLFTDKNFPASWSTTNTTVATTLGYTAVSDVDTANRGNLNRNKAQAAAATQYSSGWVMKKRAAAQAVFPRLMMVGSGGTTKTGSLNFDAFTGVVGGVSNLDAYGVLDLGTDWLVWMTFTTDATNTFINSRIEPAFNATLTSTVGDSTLTNSVDVLGYPLMTLGGATKLGHFYLTGILNAYSAALASMGRAISELDASTAYSLVAPVSATFPYTYDGTASYTSLNVAASLKVTNGSKVTTGLTWKYAIISGTVNGNTSDGGVAEYAMTVDGGDAYIPVTSLGSNASKIEIRAYRGSILWHQQVVLNKDIAPAPPPAGSSGAGSLSASSPVSLTVTQTANNSLATAKTSSPLSGTVPIGVTAATLTFNAGVVDTGGFKNGSVGVTAQLQRLVGSTWTNVGASGGGSASIQNYETSDGSITMSVSDTGLTGGTAYQWRVVTWVSSGTNPASIDGTLTVTA